MYRCGINLPVYRGAVYVCNDMQANVNTMRELQPARGEELDALLPSVLDRAFKGEL